MIPTGHAWFWSFQRGCTPNVARDQVVVGRVLGTTVCTNAVGCKQIIAGVGRALGLSHRLCTEAGAAKHEAEAMAWPMGEHRHMPVTPSKRELKCPEQRWESWVGPWKRACRCRFGRIPFGVGLPLTKKSWNHPLGHSLPRGTFCHRSESGVPLACRTYKAEMGVLSRVSSPNNGLSLRPRQACVH